MFASKYSHLSFLLILSVSQSYCGKCLLKCPIPFTVDPKCGSNGVTYQNIQELFCAKSTCEPDLLYVHNGPCGAENPEIATNARASKPIISVGRKMNAQVKPSRRTNSIVIDPNNSLHPFNCVEFEECVCDYILYPVCGTNGVTYGNACILECAQKCDPKLYLHHKGFCGRIFFTVPLTQLRFFKALPPGEISPALVEPDLLR